MMVKSLTHFDGGSYPPEVWTKMNYLNREPKDKPRKKASKQASQPIDPKLQEVLDKDLRDRNITGAFKSADGRGTG